MFRKVRQKDLKKILWVLVFIIIPSFVLWGGVYFISQRQQPIAKFYNKSLYPQDFDSALQKMKLFLLATYGREFVETIDQKTIERNLWKHLILVEKARKERLRVDDRELISRITSLSQFIVRGKFQKQYYLNFLKQRQVTPGQFEDFIREIVLADKFLAQAVARITVSDEEVKTIYQQQTEEAKIAYVPFLFNDYAANISLSETELNAYYEKNKDAFRVPNQVKISYIKLPTEINPQVLKKIRQAIQKKDSLRTISETFALPLEISDFFSKTDPIKGLGWKDMINILAFEIPLFTVQGPIASEDGLILFEKIEEKSSYVPELNEIIDAVKSKMQHEIAITQAQTAAQETIKFIQEKDIKNLAEALKTLPGKELKTTEFFKRGSFLEQIGLEPTLSEEVFKLKMKEILLKPLQLQQGIYVVQLIDFKPLDLEKFAREKAEFAAKILEYKKLSEQQKIIEEIIKESKLSVIPQQ